MTNYREVYDTTIWEAVELLSTYKDVLEKNDLQGLEAHKSRLTALKGILNQIYEDSTAFYIETKDSYSDKKDELFLEYCKTETNGVAERKSKLDSKDLRKKMNEFKIKRNKVNKMLEDVTQVIIDIAGILKRRREEVIYG